MDYGHTQKFDLDEFNLNSDEWDASPGRDPRSLGNSAIVSSGEPVPGASTEVLNPAEVPQFNNESIDPVPELGQIVPTMPPGYDASPSTPDTVAEFDESALKTADRLDSRAVKIIDDAVAKLNQDGNIADFYDTARGMMETHLDNSYNRKLAV